MQKIKTVLRLAGLGLSQRQIALSCQVGQATVSDYLRRAAAAGIRWPEVADWDEDRLRASLTAASNPALNWRKADDSGYAEIRRELKTHKHLPLQLLWQEYRDRQPDGYGYSRYCGRRMGAARLHRIKGCWTSGVDLRRAAESGDRGASHCASVRLDAFRRGVSFVAGEVRDARKNLLRALTLGMLVGAVLYLSANAAYLKVMTVSQIAGADRVGADLATRCMGRVGGAFVATTVLLSIIGAVNGCILTGARLPFAQARDGLFVARFGRVRPRFRTPRIRDSM